MNFICDRYEDEGLYLVSTSDNQLYIGTLKTPTEAYSLKDYNEWLACSFYGIALDSAIVPQSILNSKITRAFPLLDSLDQALTSKGLSLDTVLVPLVGISGFDFRTLLTRLYDEAMNHGITYETAKEVIDEYYLYVVSEYNRNLGNVTVVRGA